MTRVCSLLPSATEIVARLDSLDALVGVSAECRWPAEVVGKPVVSAAKIDLAGLSGVEIDKAVRRAVVDGRSLYEVDAELLRRLAPDLIVTQDLCAVCAVSGDQLTDACPAGAKVLSLDPHTLTDVADSVRKLAAELGRVERGELIVSEMQQTIEATARAVRGLARKRVFFAEWVDPPFCAGHWLPEMIELAGGTDMFGRPGESSQPTTWDAVRAARPELVVIAPCGLGAEDAAAAAEGLELDCPAVAVDADGYYVRPGPRLAEGVAQLAHLFHPEHAPDPGLPVIALS